MDKQALKATLVAAARRMNQLGINQGSSGNLGVRLPSALGAGFLVTPSGLDYEAMTAADIVEMDFSGDWQVAAAGRKPTSEWRFHRDILAQRPEFGAVVHSHAIFATTLACLGKSIPAFHYMVAIAGGTDIRCCGYETFGSAALSHAVLAALEGRKACLLGHHGLIACGRDLTEALKIAVEVETLANQYWRVLQLAAEPPLLSAAEMSKVLEKFAAGYGYASGPGAAPADPADQTGDAAPVGK
jgi:L-fuculose-phosphate aldolase|tara:strand:+ start:879 stop:1607 length:729 start_codon:yes stop_codon:yes gene_type:complete